MKKAQEQPVVDADERQKGSPVDGIMTDVAKSNASLLQGLKNIAKMPVMGEAKAYLGSGEVEEGVIGFRRGGRGLDLAIACGRTMVAYVALSKFCAMVEHAHLQRGTILLENFKPGDDRGPGHGQVLGRLVLNCSAIVIYHGMAGDVIANADHVIRKCVYYLRREEVMAFYHAAKVQLGSNTLLEEKIAAYSGWKAFEVPLVATVFDDKAVA